MPLGEPETKVSSAFNYGWGETFGVQGLGRDIFLDVKTLGQLEPLANNHLCPPCRYSSVCGLGTFSA